MIERRFLSSAVSIRAGADGSVVVGYASKFGAMSHDLGGFREMVMPGAFTRALQSGADVCCLRDHDHSLLLGRTRSKTLALAEDGVGLRFNCVLPDTTVGRDTAALIARSDLAGCSFAFAVDGPDGEEWTEDYDDEDRSRRIPLRKLRNLKLFDVSVVTSPAYPSTSVGLDNMPVHISSLQRSHEELFPHGVPVEVRNHVSGFSFEGVAERRRRLTSSILGL